MNYNVSSRTQHYASPYLMTSFYAFCFSSLILTQAVSFGGKILQLLLFSMCQARGWGFPSGPAVMNCVQCGRYRRRGFNPLVGKIPGRRAWSPSLVFLSGKSHGERSLAGYSPWSGKESDDWSDGASHLIRLLGDWQNDCPWTMGKKSLTVWELGVGVVEWKSSLELLLEGNRVHGNFQNGGRL